MALGGNDILRLDPFQWHFSLWATHRQVFCLGSVSNHSFQRASWVVPRHGCLFERIRFDEMEVEGADDSPPMHTFSYRLRGALSLSS